MLKVLLSVAAGATLLAACEPVPVSPERAAQVCEERARSAQGPTGSVNVGANSRSGGFVGGELVLSSDFLQGRDPLAVYEDCVIRQTGAPPIRPPRLRS